MDDDSPYSNTHIFASLHSLVVCANFPVCGDNLANTEHRFDSATGGARTQKNNGGKKPAQTPTCQKKNTQTHTLCVKSALIERATFARNQVGAAGLSFQTAHRS